MNIENTLDQRGRRYGDFADTARTAQNIKKAMQLGTNWSQLTDAQREALELTATKIARILNGNPDFHDSWYDIEGYVRLVSKTLQPNLFGQTETGVEGA